MEGYALRLKQDSKRKRPAASLFEQRETESWSWALWVSLGETGQIARTPWKKPRSLATLTSGFLQPLLGGVENSGFGDYQEEPCSNRSMIFCFEASTLCYYISPAEGGELQVSLQQGLSFFGGVQSCRHRGERRSYGVSRFHTMAQSPVRESFAHPSSHRTNFPCTAHNLLGRSRGLHFFEPRVCRSAKL